MLASEKWKRCFHVVRAQLLQLNNCPSAALAPRGTSPEGKLQITLQHIHHSSSCLGGNVFFTKVLLSSRAGWCSRLMQGPGLQASDGGFESEFCFRKQQRNVERQLAVFSVCRIDIVVILNSSKTATLNAKLPLAMR